MKHVHHDISSILDALDGRTVSEVSEEGRCIVFDGGTWVTVKKTGSSAGVSINFRRVKPGFTFRKEEIYVMSSDPDDNVIDNGKYGVAVFTLREQGHQGHADCLKFM